MHATFLTAEEAAALEPFGFLTRIGVQFHFENSRVQGGGEPTTLAQDQALSAPTLPAPTQHTPQGSLPLFSTFEEFLASLKNNRRKSIRQERKSVAAKPGMRIRRLTGPELQAEGDAIWHTFLWVRSELFRSSLSHQGLLTTCPDAGLLQWFRKFGQLASNRLLVYKCIQTRLAAGTAASSTLTVWTASGARHT